jgi:5S rRNA maturation endonuclease (ribonuclease M5)
MLPAESRDMIRARQRRATSPERRNDMKVRREKAYEGLRVFLTGFVRDLNQRSEEGWVLLIEGPRDARAMRLLGYEGSLVTVSAAARNGKVGLSHLKKVMVFTDLDREGASLAAKFVKRLGHDGIRTSLEERRRLKAASRGVFLHVENLSRFAKPED